MMDLATMREREARVLADAGITLPALPKPGKVVSRDAPAIPAEGGRP